MAGAQDKKISEVKDIADELDFGKYPYQKLKYWHVYIYRKQFNLPPRKKGMRWS